MTELNPYESPRAEEPEAYPESACDLPCSIESRVEEEDLLVAAELIHSHYPQFHEAHRQTRYTIIFVGLVSCAAGLSLVYLRGSERIVGPLVISIGLLALVAAAKSGRRSLRKAARQQTKSLIKKGLVRVPNENTNLRLDSDGVVLRRTGVTLSVEWEQVLSVHVWEGYCLIFIEPLDPVVVSSSAFATAADFHGFCRLAERLWAERHGEVVAG